LSLSQSSSVVSRRSLTDMRGGVQVVGEDHEKALPSVNNFVLSVSPGCLLKTGQSSTYLAYA
jgi:hypothetical protein